MCLTKQHLGYGQRYVFLTNWHILFHQGSQRSTGRWALGYVERQQISRSRGFKSRSPHSKLNALAQAHSHGGAYAAKHLQKIAVLPQKSSLRASDPRSQLSHSAMGPCSLGRPDSFCSQEREGGGCLGQCSSHHSWPLDGAGGGAAEDYRAQGCAGPLVTEASGNFHRTRQGLP